jgi:hypothetical protein
MRVRLLSWFLCAGVLACGCAADRAPAMPLRSVPADASLVTPVSDTCWWWGTRWQYGWRGYGWYACWDEAKPFPTVVAPEAVPEQTAPPESCVKTWRDKSGKRHSRTIC